MQEMLDVNLLPYRVQVLENKPIYCYLTYSEKVGWCSLYLYLRLFMRWNGFLYTSKLYLILICYFLIKLTRNNVLHSPNVTLPIGQLMP